MREGAPLPVCQDHARLFRVSDHPYAPPPLHDYAVDPTVLVGQARHLTHAQILANGYRPPWLYYGPDGLPTDRVLRVMDLDERRVAFTGGLWWLGRRAYVSTVLMPAHPVMVGAEVDRPFASAVFAVGGDEVMSARCATRAAALERHDQFVEVVRLVSRARAGRLRRAYAARRRGRS